MNNKPIYRFSPAQIAYMNKSKTSWYNVAEGGYRSGKNALNVRCVGRDIDYHPNSLHLIGGYTSGTAGAVIYKSDDVGLERYFKGRCRPGKYEDKPCFYVETPTGRKTIIKAGGNNVASRDYIAGFTFGVAYITEANRCHPGFLEEVFARTFSSKNRKVYHDINPKAPGHWYYTDVLDYYEKLIEKDPSYGYNYGHFTMADNLSMSDDEISEVVRSVKKGTVGYTRGVLGKRVQASGLVHPEFNRDFHVKKTEPRPYSEYYISMDGGTNHPTVFILWGLHDGKWWAVKEYYHHGDNDGQKTPEKYYQDLLKFVGGLPIKMVYLDNAPVSSGFNVILKQSGHFRYQMADNTLLSGIQSVSTALSNGILFFNDCCKNIIREFELYMWDDKSTDDMPKKENDDSMTAIRYFAETKQIIRMTNDSIIEAYRKRGVGLY